jgi:hypothetical protein
MEVGVAMTFIQSAVISNRELSPLEIDGDVVGAWTFTWNSGTETPDLTDHSGNGNDLTQAGTLRYTAVGNLDGVHVGSGNQFNAPVTPDLRLYGDMTIEVITGWAGKGPVNDILVGHFLGGEAEANNALYLIKNGQTNGQGLTWFIEYGAAADDDNVQFPQVEPNGAPTLITFVRDDFLNVRGFLNGHLIQVGAQTQVPTGGTAGYLQIGTSDPIEDASVAGVYISNVARSDANVLARAKAAGFTR